MYARAWRGGSGAAREGQLEHLGARPARDGEGRARLGLAPYQSERDRAEAGGVDDAAEVPDELLAEVQLRPRFGGRGERQPAQVSVRLALVEQAGDGLLADVAALREADGAVVEAGLLGDRRL